MTDPAQEPHSGATPDAGAPDPGATDLGGPGAGAPDPGTTPGAGAPDTGATGPRAESRADLSAELSAELAAELDHELSADETGAEVEAALAVAIAARPAPRGPRAIARRMLRSRRGLLVIFMLVAGFGSAVTVTGVAAIQWTETADFCGRCHTMGPELKAYEMSPHREVQCAECHVEPGIAGWVQAKINGTKQLFQIITNTFPKPIPAPDHSELPPVSGSCEKCHDKAGLIRNGGPVNLVLQNQYREDEVNTRDAVALVIRPNGFGGNTATKGVHWHIETDVEYWSADPRAQTIDVVTINDSSGGSETWIASKKVTVSSDVQPDIDAVTAAEEGRRVDCIVCHNRVGHGIPSVNQAIDNGIDAGQISVKLPYIKREALDRLSIQYAADADADAAIDGLRAFYGQQYPLVLRSQAGQLNNAIDELKRIYRLVATPEMQVTGATYPNNLGHQTAPGCFRCHDGAHYKVVDGALTDDTIPSGCATCHTFPQIGAQESGVLIGQRPDSHSDRLWVFDHKSVAASVDPSTTECGACHTRTYCQNCHDSPAAKVPHDNMVINHADVTRKVGAATCATCHQQVFCAQCHATPMLPAQPNDPPSPSPSDGLTGALRPPDAIQWPLLVVGRP